MNPELLVDTNVALTANGDATHASIRCQMACIDAIERVMRDNTLLLDSSDAILEEYLNQRPYDYPQNVGDIFLVWAYDNQAHPQHCRVVNITPLPNDARMFAEFPDDHALLTFDPSDKKFVAVALASKTNPPILNATDSDWRLFEQALQKHGVQVEQLCTPQP